MEIDKALISKLEKLSRLELSEPERISIQKDLNEILTMVEKLNEVNTEGVEPLIYISTEEKVWRADEVKNQLPIQAALKNAPLQDGQYFLVPKVIDRG
ncbi:MAG: aspartyl-tRNA(Asn)/glutamyl-tRNA(Gln) amidotransferase subunit C [Saprospiraceae bacterium]|jgi:aspartyl-tRNA(Asn)/glutamyl-tRNA(Gln) amidotransferase subunit C